VRENRNVKAKQFEVTFAALIIVADINSRDLPFLAAVSFLLSFE
jgi:hypothetical protein